MSSESFSSPHPPEGGGPRNTAAGEVGARPPVKRLPPEAPPASGRTLWGVPAARLAELVRSRRVSPIEVIRQHLDRIEAVEPEVNAFQTVLRKEALAGAAELERRSDLADLPLAGVPVAVKDCFDVAGIPTRQGSRATSDGPAANDDPLVAKLRAAGAVVIGKSAQPELAIWAHTETLLHGATRNPWDPRLTPGGSTGGGAAAVTSGMAPLALGTDGGGSIRIPSAMCGLFGLKPSSDVLGPPGGGTHWHGLTASGPLATSVPDAALMLEILTGDPRFGRINAPSAAVKVAVSVRSPLAGVRAGRAFKAAVEAAASALAAAGHEVREATPAYPPLVGLQWTRNWLAGIAVDVDGLPHPERLERTSQRMAGLGRRFGPDTEAPRRWQAQVAAFFADHDVLLMPTIGGWLPATGWTRRGFVSSYLRSLAVPFTQVWNFADLPAISIPRGLDASGRPLSVQLVAGRGGESLLLSLALQLEAQQPWPRLAPLREIARGSANDR